ncbi:MAG: PrsW family glutamic-type intramembrane protease [Patescibacteria group bacterium]
MPTWFPAIASIILALVPVFVWLDLIHREGEDKGIYIKTFLAGTFAVIPPFALILLFDKVPELNIYSLITRSVHEVALAALLTNIVVGIVEEIGKNIIVRVVDKRHPEYVQTISSALRLSICAGMGFAFAENIFYFYNVWVNPQFGAQDLFATFVFRSVFTMCGHMVFSGIFGYYFGIGKFSADITEFERWEGKGLWLARLVSRLTGKMTFQVVREFKNLQGLFLAMTLHAAFNVSLDLEHKLPSILIVAVSVIYILYLLQTKSGHLMFSMTRRRASSMAPKDEDVVLELLGMWTAQGKYADVIQICDRLLARDPDNNVVKLFRAKAGDNAELKGFYTSLKAVFEKNAAFMGGSGEALALPVGDEKVVLEVMDKWYQEKKYGQVLDVAKKLLDRNPQSQGAKVLLDKALDKEKIKRVFDSLSELFKE